MRYLLALLAVLASAPLSFANPPTYACVVPGQWWQSYSVTTNNGTDTYAGIAGDCTGFSVSVPTGTKACAALGSVCPVTTIAPEDFINRFSTAEQQAIVTATQTNWQLQLWMNKLTASSSVDVTDPRTTGGIQALVSAGLLTAARGVQVLNLAVSSP